ncbi:MAG: cytochrome b N-terminal domain-containing protein [Rhodospirillales bacterium]
MRKSIRRPLQNLVLYVEAAYDRSFGPNWNPLRQLGSLTFFMYWVVIVTGIYVYIFFETSAAGAYQSVEYLTYQQWYVGGVMRSLHRYASDAMVVMVVMHLSREFIFDRYRDVRWFTWFLGVPLLWFLFFSGISGYWLVWDQLAQYIAIASMEWIDWLGIFGEPIANNFLTRGSLSDRFFSLLIFMHIFSPLIMLFIMWFHVMRVSRPKINPPRGLAACTLLMLVVLSLVKPALSHAPADLGTVPAVLKLDWFFMLLYPVYENWGGGVLWGLAAGLTLLFAAMPWLPPMRLPKPAVVNLEECNGCARCYDDCPFNAVIMQPRTDGRPFEREAVVNEKLCTACGICVGSCPISTPFRSIDELTTAIDLVDFPLKEVRVLTNKAVEELKNEPADGRPRIIVFGCDHGADIRLIEQPGVAGFSLPCIAMLPPSFIDYALSFSRGGIDGVLVASCRQCDCFNRLGDRWLHDRLDGTRDPYLRKRVPRQRVHVSWVSKTDGPMLEEELECFRASLETLADEEGKINSVLPGAAPGGVG